MKIGWRWWLGVWVLAGCLGCERPLDSVELLERGIMLAQREQFNEAVHYFDRSIALRSENPSAYFERAIVMSRLGNKDKALEDYANSIRFNPDFVLANFNRGELLADLGQHELAVADFTRTIEVEPTFFDAVERRGLSFQALGRFDGAMLDFDRAIDLVATARGYYFRGQLWLENGNFVAAEEDFSEAVRIDEFYARAWFGRAVARSRQGDTVGARADLVRAGQLDTGIVSDDILGFYEDLAGAHETGSEADWYDDARDHLAGLGWKVGDAGDKVFAFRIANTTQTDDRLVYVGLAERGNEHVAIPVNAARAITAQKGKKSLLIGLQVEDGKRNWRLVEDWDFSSRQIDVLMVRIGSATDASEAVGEKQVSMKK